LKSAIHTVIWAAAAVTIYCVFTVTIQSGELPKELRLWGSFASLGVLVGSIWAFDRESNPKVQERPIARILLSAAAGLGFGLINSLETEGLLAAIIGFGILGYIGDLWLKHV
jgi:hypothetical protein